MQLWKIREFRVPKPRHFTTTKCSKYLRGGGTVREQFENSSRIQFVINLKTVPEWHMKRKGKASSSSSVQFEIAFARVHFLGEGGGLHFISSSRSCRR